METAILPPAAWFRWRLGCPRADGVPATSDARLCPLPDSSRLPVPSALGGDRVWWDLRVGWNPAGLAFALEVDDGRAPVCGDADLPEMSDGLELGIATRETRDIHRATRYCHRFLARVERGAKGGTYQVLVEQRKLHRAVEDAKISRQPLVRSRIGLKKGGWWLDLFFSAESLTGYDPETNPTLGLTYALHDPVRGDRFLSVGRDYPIGEDPSLWSTLELTGGGSGPSPAPPAKGPRRARKPRD